MYSTEEKEKALEAYVRNNRNAAATVRELGYPTTQNLMRWVRERDPELPVRPKRHHRKYSDEEKKKAIDLYFKNDCNMRRTIGELGYGSATGLLKWLREAVPDRVSKPVPRTWKRDYPEETKQQAVLDLISNESFSRDIAAKYGISRATLYEWKVQYLGKADCILKHRKEKTIEDYKQELQDLREETRIVKEELKRTEEALYRAHLEKDVYEKAAEILKKGMGDDLRSFSNREKAMVIIALKGRYPLKDVLSVFDMAKSSFCYQQSQMAAKADRHQKLRTRIKELFEANRRRYGYRRIHALLKREGITVSEKTIRRIMKKEHLVVRITRCRKYNSYKGEISPAVPNRIERDFHSNQPNEKWLTDITEFKIGEKKVYLSPIIDCMDGLPVEWTIGTSPNAALVNRMLDKAVKHLKKGEHPIVHSDRGCHYRWPGWIERMKKYGLIRSMSKKGCSPDNSACEGFFGRMKNEMYYGYNWDKTSVSDFIQIVNEYMNWYREERIKISLGGMSPMEYRRSLGLA